MNVICKNITKIYRIGQSDAIFALRDISFVFKSSTIYSIMGPSGSGKTTLRSIIGGIIKPSTGYVFYNDTNIAEIPLKKLDSFRLRNVGFIFQFFNLIPSLSVRENIELPMILINLPREIRIKRTNELLKRLDILGKKDSLISNLSGGEQQRVAIAVALANDPPIILADEPTGELDLVNTHLVSGLLSEIGREDGKTVIIATHDPLVASYADIILILEKGSIVETLTNEQFLQYTYVRPNKAKVLSLIKRRERIQKEIDKINELYRDSKLSHEDFFVAKKTLEKELEMIKKELRYLQLK